MLNCACDSESCGAGFCALVRITPWLEREGCNGPTLTHHMLVVCMTQCLEDCGRDAHNHAARMHGTVSAGLLAALWYCRRPTALGSPDEGS